MTKIDAMRNIAIGAAWTLAATVGCFVVGALSGYAWARWF